MTIPGAGQGQAAVRALSQLHVRACQAFVGFCEKDCVGGWSQIGLHETILSTDGFD